MRDTGPRLTFAAVRLASSINHWRGRAAKLASSAYSCWEWIGWFERVR